MPVSIRDPLDRYYTRDDVALKCTQRLIRHITRPHNILEPSVGGGAFARACKKQYPGVAISGCDIDPNASGFLDVDYSYEEDFKNLDRGTWDLIVGNPPYSEAQAHVEHAHTLLDIDKHNTIAFLLRLGFLASQSRQSFWKQYKPEMIYILSKRPSFTNDNKTDSSDYAFYIWRPNIMYKSYYPVIDWL